jgi:hypothetical protein
MTTTTTAAKTAKTGTRAERKAERKAAAAAERKAMAAAMKSLGNSFELDEEDRRIMRAFESLTAHYSEGNALLILAQADALGLKVRGLQDVGGSNAFAERGRLVRDTEKSHRIIGVWARITRDDQEADMVKDATDTTTGAKRRERYAVVGIYHISQTDPID